MNWPRTDTLMDHFICFLTVCSLMFLSFSFPFIFSSCLCWLNLNCSLDVSSKHVLFISIVCQENLTENPLFFNFWKIFQSASLCLTTTTPEQLASALRWFMVPFTVLRVPVAEIILTLLLSLRFINLVFDEASFILFIFRWHTKVDRVYGYFNSFLCF